jgi:hypothetical protein
VSDPPSRSPKPQTRKPSQEVSAASPTTSAADERYHQPVSNLPSAPSTPPPWQPVTPTTAKRRLRWPLFALVIALVVIGGVAIGAWFRPLPDNKSLPAPPRAYTDQEVADAKTTVCAAYTKVHQAVLVNTGRSGGSDPTAQLAVAANARMALYDGGEYLLTKLTEEPATPPDLAKATRELVSAYHQLAIDYMAEAPDPEKESSGNAVSKAGAAVYQMCK